MDIRIAQPALAQMFGRVQGIIDRKSAVSVLAHVVVETAGRDAVRVRATDYDVALLATYPAEVVQPGAACVNGAAANDAVRTMRADATVSVHLEPTAAATFDSGGVRFTLPGIPAADFPGVVVPDEPADALRLPAAEFLAIAAKVAHAMSSDTARANLCGVCFQVDESGPGHPATLRATAVDGHRLAHVRRDITGADGVRAWSGIVSRRGIEELRRVFAGAEGDAVLYAAARNIYVRCGDAVLASRQVDDAFPAYERALTEERPTVVRCRRADLSAALRAARVCTSAKAPCVVVEVSARGVALSVQNPDRGEVRAAVDGEVRGPAAAQPAVYGLSASYLDEALGCLGGDTVHLGFDDAAAPVHIYDPDDQRAIEAVALMRIKR